MTTIETHLLIRAYLQFNFLLGQTENMNWHCLDTEKVLELTGSSKLGLTGAVAESRLKQYGLNELQGKKKKSPYQILFSQFSDFMILILIAAAIVSIFVGDLTDSIVILVIVIINAVVGFIQQYRAEKALDALKKMAAPHTTVTRGGQPTSLSSSLLVPGDIVLLEAGMMVPADLRLLETHVLELDEASLTGESVGVTKTSRVLKEPDLVIGDRLNMAFKGTIVTKGKGIGVVVETGMNTELGHIARLLQEGETSTPLQKRMNDFGKKLSYIILAICLVLFFVGLLRGERTMNMLLVAISLAVAAIPEALPALITVALATGAKRLVRRNALVRKLPAVETLGSVTFICTDKTGTLTQNKMKVVKIEPRALSIQMDPKLSAFECFMIINHDLKKTQEKWLGDPTEVALVEYVEKQRSEEYVYTVQNRFPAIASLPFDSDRKCMTTIHRLEGKFLIVSKGAVESIVSMLSDREDKKQILQDALQLAHGGIRVLAYAFRVADKIAEPLVYSDIESNLKFAGLAGMSDAPRPEAREAIASCKAAGIRPVMITGDHRETAQAIATEIGLLEEQDLVITGKELNSLTDDDLDNKVERIKVYARVSPQQKLNIVRSLQRRKQIVGMTGDGVNDAPSLKAADIGIAMGITGTDVSKEASHLILLDDNFATIVNAIKEGRRIYDNIRKFVRYIMTCNGAEIWTLFLAPVLGLPIPLLPIHILWINLVTDGLPGLALTAEKAEGNIMKRPPRKTDESLFAGGTGYHIIWMGLLMAFIILGLQAWAIQAGKDTHWQTMVFTSLTLAQLGHVFGIRSEKEFIFNKGIFSNVPLLGSVVLTVLLQACIVYLPWANETFKTKPLTTVEFSLCLIVSAVIFHAVELEKWIRRRFVLNGR